MRQDSEQFQKDWQNIIKDTTSLAKKTEQEVIELFRLFEFPVSIFHHHLFALFICTMENFQIQLLEIIKHLLNKISLLLSVSSRS